MFLFNVGIDIHWGLGLYEFLRDLGNDFRSTTPNYYQLKFVLIIMFLLLLLLVLRFFFLPNFDGWIFIHYYYYYFQVCRVGQFLVNDLLSMCCKWGLYSTYSSHCLVQLAQLLWQYFTFTGIF